MKTKNPLRYPAIVALLLLFGCTDELEDCYETVCSGPDNTNCVEVPVPESGCFPNQNSELNN